MIFLQKEIDLEAESLSENTMVLQIEARQANNPSRSALSR